MDSWSPPVCIFLGSGGWRMTGMAKPPSHRAAITMEMRIGRYSSVGTPSRLVPMRPT